MMNCYKITVTLNYYHCLATWSDFCSLFPQKNKKKKTSRKYF